MKQSTMRLRAVRIRRRGSIRDFENEIWGDDGHWVHDLFPDGFSLIYDVRKDCFVFRRLFLVCPAAVLSGRVGTVAPWR